MKSPYSKHQKDETKNPPSSISFSKNRPSSMSFSIRVFEVLAEIHFFQDVSGHPLAGSALASGKNVMVHCLAGAHRAGTTGRPQRPHVVFMAMNIYVYPYSLCTYCIYEC